VRDDGRKLDLGPISSIEQLRDAVMGAGLEATQMSRAPATGSLAFATHDGVTYSSGYIGGRVALTRALSESMITVGVGLAFAPGTRHWLNELTTGVVGAFVPGDGHDALYTPGLAYAAATLSAERLEAVAADMDLVLDARTLGRTGVSASKLSITKLSRLQQQFAYVHRRHRLEVLDPRIVGKSLLPGFVNRENTRAQCRVRRQ
jgi:hypothetical protein